MAISKPFIPPLIRDRKITVSRKAKGSLLPLSTSNREAVLYLRFIFLDLNIENTLAASVEEIIAPISMLSIKSIFRI